jgi:hypothetical protein
LTDHGGKNAAFREWFDEGFPLANGLARRHNRLFDNFVPAVFPVMYKASRTGTPEEAGC